MQTATRKRFFTLTLALFLIPALVVAQPTIDGEVNSSEPYELLAEWTQNDTGFGPHGMLELYGYQDGSDLYLAIVGDGENNGNAFLLFIDVSSQSGIPAGTALPATTDGLSPFNGYGTADGGATHDFDTDFGFRIGASDDGGQPANAAFFASAVDYRSLNASDQAEETFFPGPNSNSTWPADGSVAMITTAPWDGTEMAYDDSSELPDVTNEAWEVAVPLSQIGWSAGDSFQLFALYTSGSGDFISANTLPEIPGQSGSNLGSPGSFSFVDIPGDQHTSSSPLPVELTSFDVAIDGAVAQLRWTTATETNNSGFAIQHAAPGEDFQRVGWRDGAGTTTEAQTYRFRVDGLSPGAHRFRLKQVDVDGTTSLSDVVDARVGLASQAVMTDAVPNPVRSHATLQVGVQSTQPVTVELYNLLGQKVRTLHRGTLPGGRMEQIDIRTSGLSSGIYIVRMQSASFSKTRRLTVVR